MHERKWLAEQFEANRAHLRAVAYRMLGSRAEADDAVQEAWLRLGRSDTSAVENLTGWLTTVVARVCLDMLRSRKTRREEATVEDAAESVAGDDDPEHEALLADSVGLALLVVLKSWPLPNAWLLCCTTCSIYRLRTLHRSSTAHRWRHGSSRAVPVAGCREGRSIATTIWPDSGRLPPLSWLHPATATLMGCWRFWIPTLYSAPMRGHPNGWHGRN